MRSDTHPILHTSIRDTSRALHHRGPVFVLEHNYSTMSSSPAASVARSAFRTLHGIVVTAGLMQRTVKVRVGGQVWNNRVKKVLPPTVFYNPLGLGADHVLSSSNM